MIKLIANGNGLGFANGNANANGMSLPIAMDWVLTMQLGWLGLLKWNNFMNFDLPIAVDWVLPMAMQLPMKRAMWLWWLGF